MPCQVYTTQSVAIWVLDCLTHLILAHVCWLVKVPLTFDLNKVNYLSVVFYDNILPILNIVYLHGFVSLTTLNKQFGLKLVPETIFYRLPDTQHMTKGGSSLPFRS